MPVVAPSRRRNVGMNTPNFYSADSAFPGRSPLALSSSSPSADQPDASAQAFQTVQQTVERRQAPQFEDTSNTSDYLAQQLQSFANRAAPPQLDPGARVRSPNAELVQPSNFQGFYDQLNTVGQTAQEQVGAASARAAFQRMQQMQAVQAMQVAQFGGIAGQGGNPVGYKNPNAAYYGSPAGEAGSGVFGGRIGSGLNLGSGGSPQANFAIAQKVAKQFGWGAGDINAWYTLGMKESGWRANAQNPTSTAYGIGQFLDSTWSGYGIAKTSDPGQQVLAMARYIKARYGSPSRALAFHISHNWY